MRRITRSESKQISELSTSLGERTFRQLLTSQDSRLLSRRRLVNLERGSGRISETEAAQIEQIRKNRTALVALKKKGDNQREFKTNRSLRTWLNQGKAKTTPVGDEYPESDREAQKKKQAVIRALRFLGVDPADGTYYVRKEA